jgi:hypothetical protein
VAESAGHAGHDPLRVAESVDRGARLAPVLDLCARCLSLYGDLIALTAALPLAAVPTRPRSFTLSVDDARRLRRRGIRGWWSAVGSARDTITKPLAVGLTTLGLAGLLLTAAPVLLAGSGSGAAPGAELDSRAASPAANPRTLAGDPAGAPIVEVATVETSPDPFPTAMLSLSLLALGGGLFAVRRVARHGRAVG